MKHSKSLIRPGETFEDWTKRQEREARAEDRGELTGHWTDRTITYSILSADGTLGFVSSSVRELRALLTERGLLGRGSSERGMERLPQIPGLRLYYAAPTATGGDMRPLNLVANTLVKALDPDGGYGRYRGTVAFVHIDETKFTDVTPDQREQLIEHYRPAHRKAREWQYRRNQGGI